MISGRLRKKLSGFHNHCYISSHCFFVAKRIHSSENAALGTSSRQRVDAHTECCGGGGSLIAIQETRRRKLHFSRWGPSEKLVIVKCRRSGGGGVMGVA